MTEFASAAKDRAILFGWIAGLTLAALLLWSLTFSFRATLLMRSVNRFLTETEDTRRLSEPLSQFSGHFPIGCWYSVEDSDSFFFVFTVFRDGILVPCGAEISPDGKVKNIIPLGGHAKQAWDRIPRGMINIYIQRIESAAMQVVMRYAGAAEGER